MALAKLTIDDDLIEQIEKLAGLGLTQNEIAHCLGVSPATWFNYKKDYEELGEAVGRGKARGVKEVSTVLYDLCMIGNMDAIKTFLKLCHGKSEKMEIDAHVEGHTPIEWVIQPVAPANNVPDIDE